VEALRRTRIMSITLKDLPPGKWRYFTKEEINTISAMVANSSKTGNSGSEGMDE
jgi:23S rRNA pseudouridine2604 synthase